MSKFYHQIFTAMVEIHNTKASSEAVQAFVYLAQERYVEHSHCHVHYGCHEIGKVVTLVCCQIYSLNLTLPAPNGQGCTSMLFSSRKVLYFFGGLHNDLCTVVQMIPQG